MESQSAIWRLFDRSFGVILIGDLARFESAIWHFGCFIENVAGAGTEFPFFLCAWLYSPAEKENEKVHQRKQIRGVIHMDKYVSTMYNYVNVKNG